MARTKSTPLKREISDSWIDKPGTPIRDAINLSHEVGQYPHNGYSQQENLAKRSAAAPSQTEEARAGLHELIICAGGIYASLYV